MEPKAEGSFLKQLQNKQKNLQRKLEKIEAKEKRPISELSEEEKDLLKNKSMILMMKQEYDRILSNYVASKEAPAPAAVSAPIETRVEIREIDSAPEVLALWLALHHIAQPGTKDVCLAQGHSAEAFETAVQARKEVLGAPGMEVREVLDRAAQFLARFRKPETDEDKKWRDAIAQVRDWCLAQKVPEIVAALSVDTPKNMLQVLTPAVESAPVEPAPVEPAAEEVKEAPLEEVKEPSSSWADEGDEEEPPKDEDEGKKAEDDGFVEVTSKPKRKPQPQSEPRRGDSGRRRGWRGGDRRPRGRRPPQQ